MRLLVLMMALFAAAAFAQSDVDAEVRQLQAQVVSIQHEQQTVYQQFEMLQALRRDELQAQNPPVVQNSPVYSMDTPPPNYDDMVREKRSREERIQQYTYDLNALYARYQSLEQQRQPLLARLRELAQPK